MPARVDADDDESTLIVAALVAKIDLRRWPSVKAAVLDAGGQIIFQKIAPLGTRLWIQEGSGP